MLCAYYYATAAWVAFSKHKAFGETRQKHILKKKKEPAQCGAPFCCRYIEGLWVPVLVPVPVPVLYVPVPGRPPVPGVAG